MVKTTMRRKNAKIRIGPDYQADIPDLLERPAQPTTREPFDGNIKVWAPTENISEIKLNELILLSKEQHGYNTEQAMGMLYWHNYDLEKAICDLPNFAPKPDWTPEDTVSFEAALSRHGKNFALIKRMMPNKPMTALVQQYYLRKHKIKKRSAMIDVQVQRQSSSSEHDDEVSDKSIDIVAKYFYLWKQKTDKRENTSRILDKQNILGHSSAGREDTL